MPIQKIKVGYAKFDILPFPGKEDYLFEEDDDLDDDLDDEFSKSGDQGETNYSKHIIYYDPNQVATEHVNTIMHEIGHCITYVFGMKFKKDSDEEYFVNAFTNGLVTVFNDNPELLKWMLEHLEEKK